MTTAPAPKPGAPTEAVRGAVMQPMEMVRLANLFHAMAHDPQLRSGLADLVNKKDPNGVGRAFHDVALERRFAAMEKKLDDRELKRQIDEAVAGQKRQKDELIASGRYSAEQIADIEKTMTAKGLHSYRDGAILYDAEHPPPPVTHEAKTGTWEFPTVPTRDGKGMVDFKEFKKDPHGATVNAAYRVIDEFRMKSLPPTFGNSPSMYRAA